MDTKALRQKILDLAIRGKLVPQDPNDEPATALLERIRAQKQQMVQDGKLKAKDIKDDTVIFVGEDNLHYEKFSDGTVKCIEDEIPFDLPQGWAWARLGFVGNWGAGATPSRGHPEYYGGNIPWLKTGDLNDGYITNIPECITEEAVANSSVRLNPIGSVLIAMYGATIGKLGILTFPATTNQACCACIPYNGIKNTYIFFFLMFNKKSFIDRGVGGAQSNISKEKIIETLLPIPPYREQEKIVQSIVDYFALVSKIEIGKDNLQGLIAISKSKILDLAIRGKLVPQNPSDEPAAVLLERIRTEKEALIKAGKIKRDKKESIIFKGEDNSYYEKMGSEVKNISDEIPFDIPCSWCWTRLGTLFNHNTGKALNTSNQQGSPYTYITTSNLYWEGFVLEELKEMCFTDDELDKCTVNKGDLLVCEGGDIGRSAIWEYDFPMRIQNHIHRLRPYIELSVEFYYYLMFLYKQTGRINGNGIGMQGLSSNKLHSILVPLPPLQEQKNICNAIQRMLEHLTNIASYIN